MNVVGGFPTPREDAAWCFDKSSSRLILFGGWADQWFGDLYSLDVSGIVGPPYAASSISPALGPYTGNTLVRITGLQFPQDRVRVKFTNAFGEDVVIGEWISETEVTCLTPSFERFGVGEVMVGVALGDGGYTVNRIKFQYFMNTRPSKCIAFGPGVFTETLWGVPNPFVIQAKDATGKNRTSGLDAFVVKISLNGRIIPVEITDRNDGTYLALYTAPTAGTYEIDISLDGKSIRGSPYIVNTVELWTHVKVSGIAPKATGDFACCSIGRKIVFWGGATSDMYVLDTDMLRWTVPKVVGMVPSCRAGHAMVGVNDKIIIFGGQCALEAPPVRTRLQQGGPPTEEEILYQERKEQFVPHVLNDLYIATLEKDTVVWSCPAKIRGAKPESRRDAVLFLLPGGGGRKLILHGGKDYDGNQMRSAYILIIESEMAAEWVTDTLQNVPASMPPVSGSAAVPFDTTTFYSFGGDTKQPTSSLLTGTTLTNNQVCPIFTCISRLVACSRRAFRCCFLVLCDTVVSCCVLRVWHGCSFDGRWLMHPARRHFPERVISCRLLTGKLPFTEACTFATISRAALWMI